uniref:Uncharacterized protein n=1 Tax=Cacopsylla melanoneura TaxID=428564 RepID=A0A8D8SHY2_9HEMI
MLSVVRILELTYLYYKGKTLYRISIEILNSVCRDKLRTTRPKLRVPQITVIVIFISNSFRVLFQWFLICLYLRSCTSYLPTVHIFDKSSILFLFFKIKENYF